MGRRPNPQRREELLEQMLGYVMEHGLESLSLRPLADHLETSTYTLTYQFGAKREIVSAIMEAMTDAAAASPWCDSSLVAGQRIKQAWAEASQPDAVGEQRLLVEQVVVGSLEDMQAAGARRLRDRRLALESAFVASGMAPDEAVTGATLVCATIDGLIIDMLATGETERLDRAATWLVERIDEVQF